MKILKALKSPKSPKPISDALKDWVLENFRQFDLIEYEDGYTFVMDNWIYLVVNESNPLKAWGPPSKNLKIADPDFFIKFKSYLKKQIRHGKCTDNRVCCDCTFWDIKQ